MRILRRLDQALARAEGWLLVALVWLMVVLAFTQVLLRTLYTHAGLAWSNVLLGKVDWAEPLARLLVLWVSVLGASLITRENKHIRIDLLSLALPVKWRPLREKVLSGASSALCALLFLVSLRHIDMERAFGEHLLLGIPTWVCQIILPIGFFIMALRFLILAFAWGSGGRGGRGA